MGLHSMVLEYLAHPNESGLSFSFILERSPLSKNECGVGAIGLRSLRIKCFDLGN